MAKVISNENNNSKRWKYLSFALIGILAAGSTVSFVPQQASAHITTNVQHMLEHIYTFVDGIEAKTNNLPADPASNTVVNTRASQTSVDNLQTTANTINTKLPADPASQSATGRPTGSYTDAIEGQLTTIISAPATGFEKSAMLTLSYSTTPNAPLAISVGLREQNTTIFLQEFVLDSGSPTTTVVNVPAGEELVLSVFNNGDATVQTIDVTAIWWESATG